ncbi:hypothetical protein Tsubulata_031061 [Turnera subulata]|uniref:Armadillo repeat-containing domain-containing protein n=1 Tax=Turnera subulata TaxID=218843 RepID=A0A9Q0JBN8_9ROSI|nr:hypothetical protein Tsubulata_031061 [Turnera subulata]
MGPQLPIEVDKGRVEGDVQRGAAPSEPAGSDGSWGGAGAVLVGDKGREGEDRGGRDGGDNADSRAEESGREFEKVSGIRVLVDLLDMGTGSSHRIKENAVGALLNLVRTGTLESSNKLKDAIINESGGCAIDGIRDVAHSPTSDPKSKTKALTL